MQPNEIDTTNIFLVSSNQRGIVIMNPRFNLTYEDALLLAAYLVTMAEPFAGHKFEDVLNAVQSS